MKLARVNLEPESFGDPRFAHLARLLALPGGDGHFALIKVALIWSWQTEHYTPDSPCFNVPDDVVEMALGVDGATGRAALVRARLAEEMPDGLRMRGSNHERTGWLWRIRERAEAGGRAKAENAKRKRANESLPKADDKHANGVPKETTLSSSLLVQEKDTHTPRARDPMAQAPRQPAAHRSRDAHAAVAMELHDAWSAAGRALTAELGRTATVGGAMPTPSDLATIRVVVGEWASVAVAEDRELADVACERMGRLLAVRSAKARADRDSLRWWAAPTFWAIDGIKRDLADDPAAVAARSRPGAREGPRRQASQTRGQAPAIVTDRPDGEIPI